MYAPPEEQQEAPQEEQEAVPTTSKAKAEPRQPKAPKPPKEFYDKSHEIVLTSEITAYFDQKPLAPQTDHITIDTSLINLNNETTSPEVLGPKPIAQI